MKSGGASPHKRPRLDPHHHHHGGSAHGSQHDDSVDDIQEIRDEEDSNDYYSNYGEEFEEGVWEGEAPIQPVPPPSGSRGGSAQSRTTLPDPGPQLCLSWLQT